MLRLKVYERCLFYSVLQLTPLYPTSPPLCVSSHMSLHICLWVYGTETLPLHATACCKSQARFYRMPCIALKIYTCSVHNLITNNITAAETSTCAESHVGQIS